MAIGSGFICAKAIFYVLNILFRIAALGLIGVGLWMLLDPRRSYILNYIDFYAYNPLLWFAAFIFIGVAIFVVVEEVVQQCDVMKDLVKKITDLVKEQNKQRDAERKVAQAKRVQMEMTRIRGLLGTQDILSSFDSDTVRKDFSDGSNGATKLTAEEMAKLAELYRKFCPRHVDLAEGQSWSDILKEGSRVTYAFLINSSNPVPFYEGKTYRDLRALVDRISGSGYFGNKGGRSQSPEQAKSEAASTISNAEENTHGGSGEEVGENPPYSGQMLIGSTNIPASNGGMAAAGAVRGGQLAVTVSPPRTCVSQAETVFATTLVSTSPEMHQEPNPGNYYAVAAGDESPMAQHDDGNIPADTPVDGDQQDGRDRGQRFGGGGFRSGRAGGYRGGGILGFTGRGRGGYGSRGIWGRVEDDWGGFGGGFQGRGRGRGRGFIRFGGRPADEQPGGRDIGGAGLQRGERDGGLEK